MVHWAVLHNQQPGGLLPVLLENTVHITTEYWPTDVWVGLFGQAEQITRFLATLLTALTLALVFRLGKDLFNAYVGLCAVFLLGTLAFVEFFSHEARDYPALLTGSTALMLLFQRWLTTRRPRYAVAYSVVALITLSIHLYIVYLMLAQAIFLLLFVKWDRRFLLRNAAMFVLTGLLALPRLYSLLIYYKSDQGGINWYNLGTNLGSLELLHEQMQIAPLPIGEFLLLLGLVIPIGVLYARRSDRSFRFGDQWRRIYLVAVPLVILIMAFGVNLLVANVTPRNLILILPPLAVLVGMALMVLPQPARAVIIVLIAIPAITSFQPYISNGPYREMANFIQTDFQPGDRFIVEGTQLWEHVPIDYFVQEQLSTPVPNAALMHLGVLGQMGLNEIPDPPIHWLTDASPASLEAFRTFLGHADRIWYLQNDPVGFDPGYQAILAAAYVPFRVQTWGILQNYPPFKFIEYRRIPDQFSNPYTFGNTFQLRDWTLLNDVNVAPCQTVTVESWWSILQKPTTNYSLTLALADRHGLGIAHNDSAPANLLTQLWQPHQLYLDSRTLTIPCSAQPGDYPLIFNLYDYNTLKSLPLTSPAAGAAYLTTLRIR